MTQTFYVSRTCAGEGVPFRDDRCAQDHAAIRVSFSYFCWSFGFQGLPDELVQPKEQNHKVCLSCAEEQPTTRAEAWVTTRTATERVAGLSGELLCEQQQGQGQRSADKGKLLCACHGNMELLHPVSNHFAVDRAQHAQEDRTRSALKPLNIGPSAAQDALDRIMLAKIVASAYLGEGQADDEELHKDDEGDLLSLVQGVVSSS